MNSSDFHRIRADFDAYCTSLLDQRSIGYAKPDNRHANFEEAAIMLGLPVEVIWAVYFYKHVASILNYCAGRDPDGGGEGITSRLADARNYLDLLYTYIKGKNLEASQIKDSRKSEEEG